MFRELAIAILLIACTSASAKFEPRCKLNPQDPYEFGPVLTKGPYAKQCMDTESKRAAVILAEDANSITFANFYHAGQFWIATVKKDAVTSVIFQVEQFAAPLGIPVAHEQLRFVTREDAPVVLVAQIPSSQSLAPVQIQSFDISFEYIAPRGVPFDVIKGELNNYNIVGRVVSFQTRSYEQVVQAHDNVDQYLLKVTPDQAAAVALQAIHNSAQQSFQYVYSTIKRNCSTEAFAALDEVIDYGKDVSPFAVGWPPWNPLIEPSLKALRERGLIDAGSEMPSLKSRP